MNIDPLTLILFLIFVVLPIINSILRRGQNQGGPARGPQQGRGSRPSRNVTSRQAPESKPEASLPTDDAFSRKLDEARRRVQEAMLESPVTQTSKTVQPGSSAQAGSSSLLGPAGSSSGSSVSSLPSRLHGHMEDSLEGGTLESLTPLGEETKASMDFSGSAAQLMRRRGKLKAAKLADADDGLIKLDPASIRRGIVWHQILSEPLAKRHYGRDLSQRRSP